MQVPTSSQDWDLPDTDSGWEGRRALPREFHVSMYPPRAQNSLSPQKGGKPQIWGRPTSHSCQPQPPQHHGDEGEENPQGAGAQIFFGMDLTLLRIRQWPFPALITGMHRWNHAPDSSCFQGHEEHTDSGEELEMERLPGVTQRQVLPGTRQHRSTGVSEDTNTWTDTTEPQGESRTFPNPPCPQSDPVLSSARARR